MPSRCIFFFSARRAWSTLLSRTETSTMGLPSSVWGAGNRSGSGAGCSGHKVKKRNMPPRLWGKARQSALC